VAKRQYAQQWMISALEAFSLMNDGNEAITAGHTQFREI
jgi:hypothetical protein